MNESTGGADTGGETPSTRGQWNSRIGFILAAAGSAVGLGNIWKFPYIAGENGGGIFVLIYLVFIALIGLPIMIAEIAIGRETQKSPVGAFQAMSKPRSPWAGIGWLGVLGAFVILSFYSVVAGWAMHYVWLAVSGGYAGLDSEQIGGLFKTIISDPAITIPWHLVFMGLTIAIVLGGVQKGIERGARILMPALLFLMVGLFCYCITLGDGFRQAAEFIFSPNTDKLTTAGVLEALGHSFFTLSLGMGAMITYGSYLSKDDDVVTTSVAISVLDTAVALLACMVLFPIVFSSGQEAGQGPGLVFVSLPIAFNDMPFGTAIGISFFVLLVFAALSSAISLLEVAATYFIDELKWSRLEAVLVTGGGILTLGIPSALSFGNTWFGSGLAKKTQGMFGKHEGEGNTWFELFDYFSSNWLLPLGGLGIALFLAWGVSEDARRRSFEAGTRFQSIYWGWVFLLRFVVPIGIALVILYKLKIIGA